jgi:hypothetical protein
MRIEVANRGEDGIISFKAESAAERLQLDWILQKAKALNLEAFEFAGWDDDGGGISFVAKLLEAK